MLSTFGYSYRDHIERGKNWNAYLSIAPRQCRKWCGGKKLQPLKILSSMEERVAKTYESAVIIAVGGVAVGCHYRSGWCRSRLSLSQWVVSQRWLCLSLQREKKVMTWASCSNLMTLSTVAINSAQVFFVLVWSWCEGCWRNRESITQTIAQCYVEFLLQSTWTSDSGLSTSHFQQDWDCPGDGQIRGSGGVPQQGWRGQSPLARSGVAPRKLCYIWYFWVPGTRLWAFESGKQDLVFQCCQQKRTWKFLYSYQ